MGVLTLLATGAALVVSAPPAGQVAFAILGIGVVGTAHGAGDLAIVRRTDRSAFLALYALVSLASLLWWTTEPAAALPAFLLASAVHFGMEDAPHGSLAERVSRGVALVAAPAVLHSGAYAALLRSAGGASGMMADQVVWLASAGGIAAALLLVLACQRRDVRLGGGVAALLLLPPLVGFTIGFLVLHALPQTAERRVRLGYPDTLAYLRAVAPVFVTALLLAAVVAAILLRVEPTGVRGLFAAIAALALPHLLVTPWFEAR